MVSEGEDYSSVTPNPQVEHLKTPRMFVNQILLLLLIIKEEKVQNYNLEDKREVE